MTGKNRPQKSGYQNRGAIPSEETDHPKILQVNILSVPEKAEIILKAIHRNYNYKAAHYKAHNPKASLFIMSGKVEGREGERHLPLHILNGSS